MNSKLIIEGNKEVSIGRITQWHTYDGLLEGLPTDKMNEEILAGIEEEARKYCGIDEVYLIEPVQTPIAYDGRYPFGKPVSLPAVTCIAALHYVFGCRDIDKDYSELGLIWFQNDYAFPIDETVLEKIKEIPFSRICGEFNY